MQFLMTSRRVSERFSDDDFSPHIPSEITRAKELYAAGFIRQIWHRGDIAGACMLIEAENEAQVHETLASLPLVQLGMLEIVNVIALKPYAGFAPDTP